MADAISSAPQAGGRPNVDGPVQRPDLGNDPVRLTPVDLSPYADGNCGIPWCLSFSASAPGPHVVLNALMHGNELSGAIVLHRLLQHGLRPRRGRLSFCFANVTACQRFDPTNPTSSRFVDEDLNRVWSPLQLDGRSHSLELDRARQLRPLYESADLLLDLHSMQQDSPPLILSGPAARGSALAESVGLPAWIVADTGHVTGRRLIDYARFAGPGGTAAAILAECGQHWLPETVAVANAITGRFLLAAGCVDIDDLPEPPPPPAAQTRIAVTHAITAQSDAFEFVQPYIGMERIARARTIIAHDDGQPVLTPYDDCVLVMPGREVRFGQTAVRLGRIVR
jgi:predicted deacylase